jgi:hypothetical protein
MVLGELGTVGGHRTFYFRKADGHTGYNMLNNAEEMDVYSLAHTNMGVGDAVDVWWCPYEPDNHHGVTLPGVGGPNVMFTYAMDGCTLVAGSRTADQAVMVHHINLGSAARLMGAAFTAQERAEQQRKIQRGIARARQKPRPGRPGRLLRAGECRRPDPGWREDLDGHLRAEKFHRRLEILYAPVVHRARLPNVPEVHRDASRHLSGTDGEWPGRSAEGQEGDVVAL